MLFISKSHEGMGDDHLVEGVFISKNNWRSDLTGLYYSWRQKRVAERVGGWRTSL